jgi:hypothetical protein
MSHDYELCDEPAAQLGAPGPSCYSRVLRAATCLTVPPHWIASS